MDRLQPTFHLRQGARYRIAMRKPNDDFHPIHLHRHTFELAGHNGSPMSGVMKDVAMLGGYSSSSLFAEGTLER
jgi:FtsP/CotA-like multicopper oxidase with cupredoxin domain